MPCLKPHFECITKNKTEEDKERDACKQKVSTLLLYLGINIYLFFKFLFFCKYWLVKQLIFYF